MSWAQVNVLAALLAVDRALQSSSAAAVSSGIKIDRIEPMMKMFKAAHLQLVLISTVEKCSAIYPYCDVIYSIIKTGSRAVLAPFEKLYEGTETQ